MVGPSNSTNKFGSSSYVVGTPANGLGNGVNFTSIQAAINQAIADGYGLANPIDIIIRAGVYTEDVTITDGGICLQGVSSGPFNLISQQVFIDGTLTLNITGSNNFTLANILVSGQVGPALSVTGAGQPLRLSASNCSFLQQNVAGPAVSVTNTSGTFGNAIFFNCWISSIAEAYYSNSRTVGIFFGSSLQGGTNMVTLDGTARVQFIGASGTSGAGFGVQFLNAANQVASCRYSTITASDSIIDMTPGGSANIEHCHFTSNAGSGFFIQGTGNLTYADVTNEGTAIGLDPGLGVITIPDWKPYAEAGAAPGTGVVRGTACFDNSQFSVVDGFVQASGSIPITFTEDIGSATPAASVLNILGGTGIDTSGAGNTVTIAVEGSVATTYNADSGSAVPVGNTLQILTGSHIGTTGAGNTITINLAGSVPTDWLMDGATTAQSVGGQMNLVGGAGIRTSGNGSNTITINGITYADTAVNVTAQDDEGYFAVGGGAVTITTQAGAAQGASLGVVRVGATNLVVDAQPGQFIQIGNSISTSGGLATSSADGDALTLVFRSTGSIWFATSVIGNWTLS